MYFKIRCKITKNILYTQHFLIKIVLWTKHFYAKSTILVFFSIVKTYKGPYSDVRNTNVMCMV